MNRESELLLPKSAAAVVSRLADVHLLLEFIKVMSFTTVQTFSDPTSRISQACDKIISLFEPLSM